MISRGTPVNGKSQRAKAAAKSTDERKPGSVTHQGYVSHSQVSFEENHVAEKPQANASQSPEQKRSPRIPSREQNPKHRHENGTEMTQEDATSSHLHESSNKSIEAVPSKPKVEGEPKSRQKTKQSSETNVQGKQDREPGTGKSRKEENSETPDGELHVIGYTASNESVHFNKPLASTSRGPDSQGHTAKHKPKLLYHETADGESHVIGYTLSSESFHSDILLNESDDQLRTEKPKPKSNKPETTSNQRASIHLESGRKTPNHQECGSTPLKSVRQGKILVRETKPKPQRTSINLPGGSQKTNVDSKVTPYSKSDKSPNKLDTSVSSRRSSVGSVASSDHRIKFTNSRESQKSNFSEGAKPKTSQTNLNSRPRKERRVYFDPVEHSRRIRFETQQDEPQASEERNERSRVAFDPVSTRDVRFNNGSQISSGTGTSRQDHTGSQSSSRTDKNRQK